jgi:hypothetical protein
LSTIEPSTIESGSPSVRQRLAAGVAAAALSTVLLSACVAADEPAAEAPAVTSEMAALKHVHGIAVEPADDRVLVATHEGLFRLSAEATRGSARSST